MLVRYFSSRTTEKESARIEAWANKRPENRAMLERWRKIWRKSEKVAGEWDTAVYLQKLNTTVAQTEEQKSRKGRIRLIRITPQNGVPAFSFRRAFSIAALVMVLAGAVYVLHDLKELALQSQLRGANLAVQEASTKPGQQVQLQFADGTKAVLNSASSLKYSVGRNGVRNVYLKGEAYFSVVHSDIHPFIVHVHNGTIRDIGTQFDVEAWPHDNSIRVAVMKGMVSVQPKGRKGPPIVLGANEFSVMNIDGAVTPPTTIADISRYIQWMDGKYSFFNDPLKNVMHQIWRTYGVHCFVSDSSILSRRITTSFTDREPPRRVVDIIALSLHLTYRMSGDSVLFTAWDHSQNAGRDSIRRVKNHD